MEQTLKIEQTSKRINLLDKYPILYNCALGSKKKRNFQERLLFGQCGEVMVLEALSLQIIRNEMYVKSPDVDPKSQKSKDFNATYGDISFFNSISMKWEFIDVKNTQFISLGSLNRFVDGGWYFLNALVYSEGKVYYMIKKNQAFLDYLKTQELVIRRDNDGNLYPEDHQNNGYYLNFYELPPTGLEIHGFDSNDYRPLISNLKIDLQSKNIDFNVIQKVA